MRSIATLLLEPIGVVSFTDFSPDLRWLSSTVTVPPLLMRVAQGAAGATPAV
jgi:hypothetical protein